MSSRAAEFEKHRKLLFSIAYRMLANVADAEDVVQESFLRWNRVDHAEVRSTKSFLCSIVTRLSIDHLRAAHVRRDDPHVTLPAPVASAHHERELADTLSVAFLVLLQKLTPTERAAFLLREVFDEDYANIADVIGKSESNCRQIVHRAKQRIAGDENRFKPSPDELDRLVRRFASAVAAGDFHELVALLSADVSVYADGGPDRPRYGKARAVVAPVTGADNVARFLIAVQAQAPTDVTMRVEEVNGEPAILVYRDHAPVAVLSFEVVERRIRRVFIQQDPAKLGGVSHLRIDNG